MYKQQKNIFKGRIKDIVNKKDKKNMTYKKDFKYVINIQITIHILGTKN